MSLIISKTDSFRFYPFNNRVHECCELAVSNLKESLKAKVQEQCDPNLKEYVAAHRVLKIVNEGKKQALENMLNQVDGEQAKLMVSSVWNDLSASINNPDFQKTLIEMMRGIKN